MYCLNMVFLGTKNECEKEQEVLDDEFEDGNGKCTGIYVFVIAYNCLNKWYSVCDYMCTPDTYMHHILCMQ